MAIIIQSNHPELLLDKIYEAIDNNKAEKWICTEDGRFTYGTLLWKNEAFFKPQIWVDDKELRLGLLKRKDRKNISSKLYSTFHTKFIELLLLKFDKEFISVKATANKTDPDIF